ncbi:MAG: hypothetical protein ACI3X9_04045 [Bacteroidaceae bacterium]
MTAALIALFFMTTDTVPSSRDSLSQQAADTMKVDTLREVTVHGGNLPIERVLSKTLAGQVPRTKSVGDVLEKWMPGINDKITHPFAIKQRKMERRHKRTRKILEHYDQVKTFDDLLREAIQRENLQQEEKENKH